MKDGLCNRGLQVTSHPSPSPTSVNTELGVLLSSGKAKQLTKEGQGFLAVPSCGLENSGTEKVRSSPESLVVLSMLLEAVSVRWALKGEISTGERAGDSHVHGQAFGVSPTRDGNIPGPATRVLLTKQKPLFKHGRQETFFTKAADEVAEAVVAHDDVRVPLAARGVIAVTVKGLHAKGTRNTRARHAEPQTVANSGPKDLRGEAAVRSIET
jgi:hypothetical protein